MSAKTESCAACGATSSPGAWFGHVVIEGRTLVFCREHAAHVAAAMPETFDALRALFVGVGSDLPGERRSPLTRRDPEDRRVFPPRPEGRRMSAGRRATDPRE